MDPEQALIECLHNLASTVLKRQIGSQALAMLPLEGLGEEAAVPQPLLLLFNANMNPEATAELLERAALRRAGQPLPEVPGAPQEMLDQLDQAAELIARHIEQTLAQARSTVEPSGNGDGAGDM